MTPRAPQPVRVRERGAGGPGGPGLSSAPSVSASLLAPGFPQATPLPGSQLSPEFSDSCTEVGGCAHRFTLV